MTYEITMPSGDRMYAEADEMVVGERILLMGGRKVVAVVSPQATVVMADALSNISSVIGKTVDTPRGKMELYSVYWDNFVKKTCVTTIDESRNSHFFGLSEISLP